MVAASPVVSHVRLIKTLRFTCPGPRRNVIKLSKVRRHEGAGGLNWFSHDLFLLLVFSCPFLASARLLLSTLVYRFAGLSIVRR